MATGALQAEDTDNQTDTQHCCKIPIVRLNSETISDTVAASLASSLLGHVLFLKNQVPLPVLQLARLSNTQQRQSGNSNTRARKHRTELLTSFDTLSSHLITTFTALSTAFARSKILDGLSIVRPPTSYGQHYVEAEETVKRASRAYLAILVGPSIGSARERVFLAVDALEARIWGEREDAPPEGESKGENEGEGESDQSENEEEDSEEGNEDSENEDQDSEEDEATGEEDYDRRERASDGHVATSSSPSQSTSPPPLPCSSPPPPVPPQSPVALCTTLPAKDEQNEAQAAIGGESGDRERQARDEDRPDNEATPPPSSPSPSPPPSSHSPSPSPPPQTPATQQVLLGAERLLSRTLALADAEGYGLASDMAPTQTHILIRAPRRFSHPAWIPRQNVTASMEKLLEEFLEESGVLDSSSTQQCAKINRTRQKNAARVGGVWVVSKESEVGSEAKGKEVGDNDTDVKNDKTNDENDEMIWWSWDGKLVGFSDW